MSDKKTVVLWRVQVESAIHCLQKTAATLNPKRQTLTKKAALMLLASRSILPYCLHPTGDDGKFFLLNRYYLPLGNTEVKGIDYEQYERAHLSPPPAGLLAPSGRLYFFGEGSAPCNSLARMKSLIERLIKFLKEYEYEKA